MADRLLQPIALGCFVVLGCAVEAPEAFESEPIEATIEATIVTNCDDEFESLHWAISQWEQRVPELSVTLNLTDEERPPGVNFMCQRKALAEAPRGENGNRIGGHAYPSHVEIYAGNLDGDGELRNAMVHELGHFLFERAGHLPEGMGVMQPGLLAGQVIITDEDVAFVLGPEP